MPQVLVPGQNTIVPQSKLFLSIKSGNPADFSSFRLNADGKTRQDSDFVFYGQTSNEDGTITYSYGSDCGKFIVDLPNLKNDVSRVAFAATSEFPDISGIKSLKMTVSENNEDIITCEVHTNGRKEGAIILGEFYRHKGQWKFRFIDQGFNGGLKPLAEYYGVDIADDQPQPAPPMPESGKKINLDKIVLTKKEPSIDLRKKNIAAGDIRINLNWNMNGKNQGMEKLFPWRKKGIDLDLGAFIEMRDGYRTIIQAVGRHFGSLDTPPYVKLLGDDRTGEAKDGEWIHVNSARIGELREILVYTFIYSGVPSWAATDAFVRIVVPGQPEVETRLTEGDDRYPMCAIARIKINGEDMRIERLDRYFQSHPDMDNAFGWGFSWTRGSK